MFDVSFGCFHDRTLVAGSKLDCFTKLHSMSKQWSAGALAQRGWRCGSVGALRKVTFVTP